MAMSGRALVSFALVVGAVVAACGGGVGANNYRPVVGVLAVETDSEYGASIIPATYVKWLMAAGARVVPVTLGQPEAYYQDLVGRLNGFVFPGGSVSSTTSLYARAARTVLRLAMESADRGDPVPVWGVCLGFQTVANFFADRKRTTRTPGLTDVSLPTALTAAAAVSRLVQDLPQSLRASMERETILYHTHRYSVPLAAFISDPGLQALTPLATNKDSNGLKFVSLFESSNASRPVFGTQWHPEKAAFDWNPAKAVNHSLAAVRAAQALSEAFVQAARGSSHVYGTALEEARAVIQATERRYFPSGSFRENWYFPVGAADTTATSTLVG